MKRKKIIRKIKALGRPLRRVAEALGEEAIELHGALASFSNAAHAVSDAAKAVTILCGKLGDLVDRELGARPAGNEAEAPHKPVGGP